MIGMGRPESLHHSRRELATLCRHLADERGLETYSPSTALGALVAIQVLPVAEIVARLSTEMEKLNHSWLSWPATSLTSSAKRRLIQSEISGLIWSRLSHTGSRCRIVTTPGVIPRVRSASNERVPDLGITCTPQTGGRVLTEPIVLIEIVSPSNEADTRRNVWAYTSIPSVAEILLLSSTSVSGELLRRNPQGEWAGDPLMLDADSLVELASVGFAASMRDIYATTSLAAQWSALPFICKRQVGRIRAAMAEGRDGAHAQDERGQDQRDQARHDPAHRGGCGLIR